MSAEQLDSMEESLETPRQPHSGMGRIGTTVNAHAPSRARSRLSERIDEHAEHDTHTDQERFIARSLQADRLLIGDEQSKLAWNDLTTTAARLAKGNAVRRPGNAITLIDSIFYMTRDAPLFAKRTKFQQLSLSNVHSWMERNEPEMLEQMRKIHQQDIGVARATLGELMVTLATAVTLGELVSLAIMTRCFVSDVQMPRIKSTRLLLDAYMVLKDHEVGVVIESIREMEGLDQSTLKEIVGQEKPDDLWQSPGAQRLNPLNEKAIDHWRDLWEMMCYITLQREVDCDSVESMVADLLCTRVDHPTKRIKNQDLGEAIAQFMEIWDNAENACEMVGLAEIMPDRLKKHDSLVTAMTSKDEQRRQIDYYLKNLADDGAGVTRQLATLEHIIDALYYSEGQCKPMIIGDLISAKSNRRRSGGTTTRAVPAAAPQTTYTFDSTTCWNCGKDVSICPKSSDCAKTNACLFCGVLGQHRSRFCPTLPENKERAQKIKGGALPDDHGNKTTTAVPARQAQNTAESSDDDYDDPIQTIITRVFPVKCATQQPHKGATKQQGGAQVTDGREVKHRSALGFVGRMGADNKPVVFGGDTWCERSILDAQAVPSEWSVVPLTGHLRSVLGISGEAEDHFSGVTEGWITLRWGAPPVYLKFLVGSTPHQGGFIGTSDQKDLGMVFDQDGDIVLLKWDQYIIIMDYVEDIQERIARPAYKVMMANAGCNLAVCAFMDLGYSFSQWLSIEKKAVCREVATNIHPKITHYASNDVNKVDAATLDQQWDLFVNTANCQPFSRCNSEALGFGDSRASSFTGGCELKKQLQHRNAYLQSVDEMTVLANHLMDAGVGDEMNEMWGDEHKTVDVADWGEVCARERWLAVSFCDITTLEGKGRVDVNALLSKGARSDRMILPCIVASESTHNPALVRDGKVERQLTPAEADRVMGYPAGITALPGSKRLTPQQRRQLIGQGLAYRHVWIVFRQLRQPIVSERMKACPVRWEDATQEQFESKFADIGHFSGIVQYLQDQKDAAGYELPEMVLQLKSSITTRRKVRGEYPVPPRLRVTCDRTLDELRKQGVIIRDVPARHEWWETEGFLVDKKQTYDDDVQKGRLVGDFRAENDALEDSPPYWLTDSPTQIRMMLYVPQGTECYRLYDWSNAYGTMMLRNKKKFNKEWIDDREKIDEWLAGLTSSDSSSLAVIKIHGERIMYVGCPQGLGPVAIFWNTHIADGLFFAFLHFWLPMLVVFVDDVMVHAPTAERMELRSDMFEAFCKVYQKPINTKFWENGERPPPQASVVAAGVDFCGGGVRVPAHTVEALEYCLTEHQQNTLTEMQHVQGAFNYAQSAFEFNIDDRNKVGELKAIAFQVPEEGKRYKQTYDAKMACMELYSLVSRSPRALSDPRFLLDVHSCMVFMSDCGHNSTSQSLHLVQRPCVSMVDLEVLKDPSMAKLLATNHRNRSAQQRAWHAFEGELKAMVDNVEDYGGIVELALMYFWMMVDKQPEAVADIERSVGKSVKDMERVGFFVDAQTAMGKWKKLRLPEVVAEHLQAKTLRIVGQIEKVARTKYWPCSVYWHSGLTISLVHLMSHMADQLMLRRQERSVVDVVHRARANEVATDHRGVLRSNIKDANVFTMDDKEPLTMSLPLLRAFGGENMEPEPRRLKGEPVFLSLSSDDIMEIQRATYADELSRVSGVPIADVYKVVLGDDNDVLPMIVKKIKAWSGTRFFLVKQPKSDIELLYTLGSTRRGLFDDFGVSTVEHTSKLVMVVPHNARVKLTTLQVGEGDESELHWYSDDMRKQLMMLHHECAEHSKPTPMMFAMQQQVWWPGLGSDVKQHYLACTTCEPLIKRTDFHGMPMVVARRFRYVAIDGKVLKQDIKMVTGVPMILVMVDLASDFTVYSPCCEGESTVDVAVEIYCAWMAYFGVFSRAVTDPGSNLVSAAMKVVYEILGIRDMDPGAVDQHTHAGAAESAIKLLDEQIEIGMAKGELTRPRDIRILCAAAMKKKNMLEYGDMTTRFERTFGEPPIHTVHVQQDEAIDILGRDLTATDSEFCTLLKRRVDASMEQHMIHKEHKTRYNMMAKDVALGATHAYVEPFTVGMVVSYRGDRWTIMDLRGESVDRATWALIRRVGFDGSETKKVMVSDIAQLGDIRTDKTYPRDPVEVNEFAIVVADDKVSCGIITSVDESQVTMHLYCKAAKLNKWRPMWEFKNGETKPAQKQPNNSQPQLCSYDKKLVVRHGEYYADTRSVSHALWVGLHDILHVDLSDDSVGLTHTSAGVPVTIAMPVKNKYPILLQSDEHRWIMNMLIKCELPVRDNPKHDHNCLLQYMVAPTRFRLSFPTGADNKQNITKIQGIFPDCEVNVSQGVAIEAMRLWASLYIESAGTSSSFPQATVPPHEDTPLPKQRMERVFEFAKGDTGKYERVPTTPPPVYGSAQHRHYTVPPSPVMTPSPVVESTDACVTDVTSQSVDTYANPLCGDDAEIYNTPIHSAVCSSLDDKAIQVDIPARSEGGTSTSVMTDDHIDAWSGRCVLMTLLQVTGMIAWMLIILGTQAWYLLKCLGIELRFGITMFVFMTSSGDNAGTYVIGCNTADC